MLVQLRVTADESSLDLPATGGDPEWLRPGTIYFVHALAVAASGDAPVAIREPEEHQVFPYFYDLRALRVVDGGISEGFEFVVQPDTELHRYIVAPSFWAQDRQFYERLLDSGTEWTSDSAKQFRKHIECFQALVGPHVIV